MSLTSCLKNSPLSGADKAAIKALAKEYRENEGMAPNPAGIAAVQDTIDETLAERAEIGVYVEKRGGVMPDVPGMVMADATPTAIEPVKAEPKKPAAKKLSAKKEGIHAKFIQELGIKKGSTLQFTRKFDYLKADTDYQVNQITDTEIFVENKETGGQTNVRISVAKAQHKKVPLIMVKAPEAEQSKPDQKNITFSESKRAGKGLSVAEVEGFIAPVQLKRFSGPKVEVVPAVSSLTKSMQALIGNKNVDGVYDSLTKTVYLVAGNIHSERQAMKVLDHESVGHYSMEEMLGDELKPILDKVQQLKQAGDETVSDIAAEVLGRYGNLDAEIESREIIAVMAEKGINSPLMRRIYAAIQRFLRSIGINRMFTATELQGIVARAANELGRPRPGGKGKGGVSLSVSEAKAQTDTAAFKKWFGDSKVVDEDGEPLVVYHGTDADFVEFSTERQRGGDLGDGFYFTDSYETAARLGKNVIPVYLSAQATAKDVVLARIKSRKDSRIKVPQKDLIINDYRGGTMYVVFKPNQIKSAVGNKGTFDPADDRIYFSQPPPSDFEQENKRLREDDNKVWNKARKSLVRYFTPGGALPRQVFGEKITRDSEFEAVEFDVRHLVGKLERAVKQEYGKRFEALDDATVKNLSNALAGNSAPTIPEGVRQEVYAMRQYIDKMSAQYATVLTNDANRLIAEAGFTKEEQQEISRIRQEEKDEATKEKLLREIRQKTGKANKLQAEAIQRAELLDTIRNNMGEYVHRSYKAFDDPKWFRKIPDDVINDAREYLTSRNVENGETQVEAERLAEQALNRIVKTDTAYDNMEAFIKEAKLGAKDLSILKKRKKIAPEIRALLGEQTDPRLNFAKSATKMGRLIWNQMFLERVRHLGMGSFFFEDKDAPPEATVQFAAEKNEVYSPLNGLWTTPEVEQAFRDALGKEQMEDWYRAIVRLNGMVKFGKTILSPTTAARNWQSAFFFTIANGHFDLSQMSKSISGFKEYFTQQGKAEQLEYLKELKRLGVVYDTPYAGEMMRLLADSKMEDMLQGKKGVAVATLEKSLELAQKFYQYGDDFWKIIGFENEKNMLMKHAGLTESEAKVEAAERIRNTYPTYSMVGRAIQSLRRFPLAGTFVSFPAEIIRTSINIMKYTAKDFKTPGMRPIAMRRIAGIAIVSGFAYALQEIMKTVIGVDDEEEEAVRQLAAPWQKNSNLVFTGRDEDGKLRYIDISFIDPYNYWKRPINAILRDQPWHKAGYDVIKETMAPFLGSDIAAGTIFEVLANKRSGSGSEIYSESDMPWEITKDIANHLRKALQPGIATNIERTLKAMDGEVSISGRKYSPFDEAMAWGGWRLSTLDPKTALYYRSFEFNDSKRDAMKKMNQALRNPNDVTDADLNSAYSLFSKLRVKAYKEMFRIVHAARKSGLSEIEVKRVLLRSGVARRDIHFLVKGKVPKWSPSSMMRKNARGKAEMLFSKEIADKITKRHNEVMRLSRQ